MRLSVYYLRNFYTFLYTCNVEKNVHVLTCVITVMEHLLKVYNTSNHESKVMYSIVTKLLKKKKPLQYNNFRRVVTQYSMSKVSFFY